MFNVFVNTYILNANKLLHFIGKFIILINFPRIDKSLTHYKQNKYIIEEERSLCKIQINIPITNYM